MTREMMDAIIRTDAFFTSEFEFFSVMVSVLLLIFPAPVPDPAGLYLSSPGPGSAGLYLSSPVPGPAGLYLSSPVPGPAGLHFSFPGDVLDLPVNGLYSVLLEIPVGLREGSASKKAPVRRQRTGVR